MTKLFKKDNWYAQGRDGRIFIKKSGIGAQIAGGMFQCKIYKIEPRNIICYGENGYKKRNFWR